MYSDSFKNLVKIASESSKSDYSDELHNKPNPYYVGFGNPNSKILIFGKEKGYNVNTDTADIMLYESINNPYEWKHYLDNNILPHTNKLYDTTSRVDFIQNDFYKSFPIIICACGSYLSDDQIEAIFDLKLINDFSKSNERLIVFSDGKRVLINTRQLSMNIKNDYLKSIADIVKDYLS
jgi:hypothetical protein